MAYWKLLTVSSVVGGTAVGTRWMILEEYSSFVGKCWQVAPPSEANTPETNSNAIAFEETKIPPPVQLNPRVVAWHSVFGGLGSTGARRGVRALAGE